MVLWAGLRLNGAPEARGWSAAPITVVFTVTAARLPGSIHSFFFIHEGSEAWLKAMESVLHATGFLYWVGAGTVAYLALRILCWLFTAVRVWGLGNESGVGPRLGEWAGESNPAPPSP